MTDVFSSLPVDMRSFCTQDELWDVLDVLKAERGRWITAGRIAERLGWPRQRTAEKVRRAKAELLLQGVPVVECHAGYKLAEYPSEVKHCLDREHQRLAGLHRTVNAYEQIYDRMKGQQTLFRESPDGREPQ